MPFVSFLSLRRRDYLFRGGGGAFSVRKRQSVGGPFGQEIIRNISGGGAKAAVVKTVPIMANSLLRRIMSYFGTENG